MSGERFVDAGAPALGGGKTGAPADARRFDFSTWRPDIVEDVLEEVYLERERQHAKWGEQNHPDGTRNGGMNLHQLAMARLSCERAVREGTVTFAKLLEEEFWEAMCEEDETRLRGELVQISALAVQWVEAIDRRRAR